MKALRILVVEDDALIGMLVADVLTEMGHEVCAIAATEATAVTAALRCNPDLMIVDARLGKGSGVSAVEKILRTGFVPHVFVSGDISSVRARRPDAVLIQKPFREPELARAIRRALAARPEGSIESEGEPLASAPGLSTRASGPNTTPATRPVRPGRSPQGCETGSQHPTPRRTSSPPTAEGLTDGEVDVRNREALPSRNSRDSNAAPAR
jgi:two-component system, response regulator PdtaR